MSRRSQLFVGRLPLDSRERDIEDIFDRYGSMVRCDLKFGTGMAYAFVDYEDKRDAEDAIKYENGRKIRGQTIVVEWARGPNSRPVMRKANAECYRCHRTGHWARDCPELERDRYSSRRYRSRSRSRSYSRRGRYEKPHGDHQGKAGRSHSRSPGYYYRGRRRWRTPSQTRSPSYNRSRRPTKKRSPTHSSSRSRSRSVSPSKDKPTKGSRQSASKSPSRSPRMSKSRSRSRSVSKERDRGKQKSRSRSLQKDQSQSPRKSVSRSRSRSSEGRKRPSRTGRSSSRESNPKDDVYNGNRDKGKHSRERSVTPPRDKSRSRSRSSDRHDSDGASD